MLANAVLGFLWAGITAYVLLGGADFGGGFWDLLAGSPEGGKQMRAQVDRRAGRSRCAGHEY